MRRSLSRRGQPTFRAFGQQPPSPKKPDLKKMATHALSDSTVLELMFTDGMTLSLTFTPDDAEKLGGGLIEGAAKSREQKAAAH
jgi:hypothetical protein